MLAGEVTRRLHRGVNPGCQRIAVIVGCAADNAGMLWVVPVQKLEVMAVVCQNGPPSGGRVGEDLGIGARTSARCLNCQHVVPQRPQPLHRGVIEVFVGVEPCHASSRLGIAADKGIDLVRVARRVLPGCLQILSGKPLNAFQDTCVGPAHAAPLDQSPNVDAGVANTPLGTVAMRPLRDPTCGF
jgi:hypothetical protein